MRRQKRKEKMVMFTQRMTHWINNAMSEIKNGVVEMPSIISGIMLPPPGSVILRPAAAPSLGGGGGGHTPPHMDEDDLPSNLMIADDDKMDTSDEQSKLSKQKLMDTLSFSFPAGSLASVLNKVKAEDDPLSQSCFSQIRLDKGEDFEDDELTSLDWLHDTNLLKNISGSNRLCPSPLSSDDDLSDLDYESGKENDSLNSSFNSSNSPLPHPSHIPYNPQKHVNSKPPYSFSCLIFMAIEESAEKKLPVKDIYSWILSHFPYFQNAPTGWKNSVRHNLSLNKCFQKVDKDKTSNIGKGSYWCIDPDYRPNLLQALRKTPYHPYHQLQMMSASPMSMTPSKFPGLINRFGSGNKNISPHLFPFLSKRLNPNSDSLDTDIDVANALVSLKKSPLNRSSAGKHNGRVRSLNMRGSRSRSPSPPEFGSNEDKSRTTRRSRRATSPITITEIPSTDHTYSACNLPKPLFGSPDSSSIDGEYEFNESMEDELQSGDEFDSEEEEEISMEVDNGKEMEGVNALLNLASVATSVMSDITKGSSPTPPITTTAKNSTTAKPAAPAKQAVPAKQTAPAKQSAPAKQAAPVKQTNTAKQTAPPKHTTTAKQTVTAKQTTPAKQTAAAKLKPSLTMKTRSSVTVD